MATLIFYDTSPFPLAAVAASIKTGQLPEKFDPARFWGQEFLKEPGKCLEGRPLYIGRTSDGHRVLSIATGTGAINPANVIRSFLGLYNIDGSRYALYEIAGNSGFMLKLGVFLLKIPVLDRIGRKIVESGVKKLYPRLVEAQRS